MQLALDFGDAGLSPPERADGRAPRRRQKIFYAVMPDEVAAAQIDRQARALWREHRLAGRLLGTGRYHVSLCGLEVDAWRAEAAIAFMRRIAEPVSAPPFAVAFDQALSFSPKAKSPHLVLSSTENLPALSDLQDRLSLAMAEAGFSGRSRYNPHVTLVYDQKVVAPTGIMPIRWRVEEFVLLRLQDRNQYERLGWWCLR